MWDSLFGRHVSKERLESTLDQEHTQVNLLFCRLESQLAKNGSLAGQLKVLQELAAFLRTHYATEESIIDECSFPLSKTHKEEHCAHHRSLEDISGKIKAAMVNEALVALYALHQATLVHIRDKDQEVADWKRRLADGLFR